MELDLAGARERKSHVWDRQAEEPTLGFDYRRALEIGAAGEHLVCADLLLSGYRAFQASQGAPYDVVVDLNGRLIRLAVKATMGPRPRPGRPASRGIYQFNIGRSKRDHRGKTTRRAYSVDDVDVVAMVALDIRAIAYEPMSTCRTMMQFAADHGAVRQSRFGPKTGPIKEMQQYPFSAALQQVGLYHA